MYQLKEVCDVFKSPKSHALLKLTLASLTTVDREDFYTTQVYEHMGHHSVTISGYHCSPFSHLHLSVPVLISQQRRSPAPRASEESSVQRSVALVFGSF